MTKKMCPMSAYECKEEKCAWWGSYEGACSIFNISTALRIMSRNYGDNE